MKNLLQFVDPIRKILHSTSVYYILIVINNTYVQFHINKIEHQKLHGSFLILKRIFLKDKENQPNLVALLCKMVFQVLTQFLEKPSACFYILALVNVLMHKSYTD